MLEYNATWSVLTFRLRLRLVSQILQNMHIKYNFVASRWPSVASICWNFWSINSLVKKTNLVTRLITKTIQIISTRFVHMHIWQKRTQSVSRRMFSLTHFVDLFCSVAYVIHVSEFHSDSMLSYLHLNLALDLDFHLGASTRDQEFQLLSMQQL